MADTTRGRHTFDLQELEASRRYDLLVGLVVPRPIGLISTVSEDGVPNLAPFSFFMVGGINPPSLMFCPLIKKNGEEKDSLRNVRANGEFVVNLVDFAMAEGINEAGISFDSDFDEWQVSGFSPEESKIVKPARVRESAAQFECRLHQIVQHGNGPSAAVYVIGEALIAHVAEELVDQSAKLLRRFEPIARLGGPEYLNLAGGDFFEMPRPKGPHGSSAE